MRKVLQALATLAAVVLVLALISGAVWCSWAGYKQRHPQGGCLGWITQPKR
jgi:hypothetical protein